jgi:hypothetical protein
LKYSSGLWYKLEMSTNAHQIIEEIQAKSYQDGWNALAQKIRDALDGDVPVAVKRKTGPKPIGNPFGDGTVAAKVYDYIKENPGMRGKDIVTGAGVDDKPGRTAMHRMKKRGIAQNENGAWRIV